MIFHARILQSKIHITVFAVASGRMEVNMKAEFFTNRQLGKLETKNILALGTEDDPIRFVIIGELSSEGQYKNSALAIRAKSLFVLDPHSGEVFETVDFDDIGEIVAKRMYSNAFLRIRLTNEGKFKNIFF